MSADMEFECGPVEPYRPSNPYEWGLQGTRPASVEHHDTEPFQAPEILSMVLTEWRSKAPAVFGSYLAETLTGTTPGRPKGQ